jgi:hypothetical protein
VVCHCSEPYRGLNAEKHRAQPSARPAALAVAPSGYRTVDDYTANPFGRRLEEGADFLDLHSTELSYCKAILAV